jgi:hypothetical protein
MAVNLSRAQLAQPDWPAEGGGHPGATGMPAASLQLEVTESLAAQDEQVQLRLHELKALGIKLALDDFGTGYSSLSSLHLLPVDTVKIDRSFVCKADTSHHHRVLIEATVKVAQSLGMNTVAEGIETPAQLERRARGQQRGAAPRARATCSAEIEVEPVGAQTAQAALARGAHARARGVVRIDLADQVHVVAAAGDGFADHFLGAALAIHLGRVDQVHAEVEAEPQRGHLGRAGGRVFAHVPGALAEFRELVHRGLRSWKTRRYNKFNQRRPREGGDPGRTHIETLAKLDSRLRGNDGFSFRGARHRDLIQDMFRHRRVVFELHRVRRPALRQRAQRGRVAEHLRQRHLGVAPASAAAAGISSMPCTMPRRVARSPITLPVNSSGVSTSTPSSARAAPATPCACRP